MVSWLRKREPKVNGAMTVGITENGRKTVQQELARGTTYVLLSHLAEHSPRSISDLAEESDVPIEEMIERVRVLEKNGYLRYAGRRVE